MTDFQDIIGLGEIAEGYDALFCDIWGVIHNGKVPFPEACEALERFRADFSRFEQFTPESLAAEWLHRWRDELVPRLLREFAESPAVEHVLRLLGENEPTHAEMQRRREFLLAHLSRVHEVDDPLELIAELRTAAQVRGGGGKNAWETGSVYEAVKDALSVDVKSPLRVCGLFGVVCGVWLVVVVV